MLSDNLAERLSRMQSLPTIPSIAMRIVDIARREDADPHALLETIMADPALSVRLLHVANSPLHARGQEVHGVREACLTLGYKSTLTLALSFSLTRVMAGFRTPNFDHAAFWQYAACTAATARVLAQPSRGR